MLFAMMAYTVENDLTLIVSDCA